MRPCTPHYVVSAQHTTTLGTHFYSTASIADSCFGIVHAVCRDGAITNATHDDSRTILRRMFAHWYQYYVQDYDTDLHQHIPDIRTHEGLLDLIYVGNIIELTPFLDRRRHSRTPEEEEEIHTAIMWY